MGKLELTVHPKQGVHFRIAPHTVTSVICCLAVIVYTVLAFDPRMDLKWLWPNTLAPE
jgi:hypothetical protein